MSRAEPGDAGRPAALGSDTVTGAVPGLAKHKPAEEQFPLQIVAIVVSLAIAAVGIALFVRAIATILGTIRLGQPAHRTDRAGRRTATMLKETLGHTRMLRWTWVGAGHWFVMIGFGLLFFTLLTAFGQLFDAHFALPLLGHFFLYEWVAELVTWVMLAAIVSFIVYRATRPENRERGVRGRLFGSAMWQGYFVEYVILGVGLCIIALRGLEYALISADGEAGLANAFHFPLTFWLGELFGGLSVGTLETLVYLVAMLKIVISFTWMITIALIPTMGVAWHRFTVWFNVFFRREPGGEDALGAMKPLTSGGERVSLDDLEELDEDTTLGVGQVEDFSWKGLLDFTTCTECGRCQSQCPAWNTDKPLSPKLLITALRSAAYAKAPYLQGADGEGEGEGDAAGGTAAGEAERPLVGDTGDSWFYMPEDLSSVIDPDVLWSCTSCGACVQQCPVDIEHVDHIMDMRRYQVMVEANFPPELNQLFKGLENKGNPWSMSNSARMDWAKDLPFDVPVVGEDVASLDEVEWLFWVGCAGAFEDRAKKTTRAVAELLDTAGVSYAVLGQGETCSGDPARRAGNEFLFQGLANENVATLQEHNATKIVATCAHCFNTLKNEYAEFGIEPEVVHHTQLLNRLVREGRLTPVPEGPGAAKRSITYHDPCFLGRHNQEYEAPRELLEVLPGAEYAEMERSKETSFCCGAGGARMWMEENLGERINHNRTQEAVGTGADQIATGCPFCRVMLSDGLTGEQSGGNAREEVEVLDVANMLLAAVKGESATKLQPGEGQSGKAAPAAAGATAGAGAAGVGAAAAAATGDTDLKAEPGQQDATQTEETITETQDTGPAAKASGGSSLFDGGGTEEAATPGAAATSRGGDSLFDTGGDSGDDSGGSTDSDSTGGSLFDTGGDSGHAGAGDSGSGGSLFDTPAGQTQDDATAGDSSGSGGGTSSGGSLFDVPAEEVDQSQPSGATPTATPAPDGHRTGDTADPGTSGGTIEPSGTGSLFDIAPEQPRAADPSGDQEDTSSPGATPDPDPADAGESSETGEPSGSSESGSGEDAAEDEQPRRDLNDGGSLFDL